MTQPMPSVVEAVGEAYRDLSTAGGALRRLALMALAFLIALDVIEDWVVPTGSQRGGATPLAVFIVGLVQTFLLTPFLIALHRHVILGETPAGYRFAAGEARFQRYFLSWAALSVLAVAPAFLPEVPATAAMSGRLVATAVTVYLLFMMVVGVRLTLLFPAIAVDAPGAGWWAAIADTRGHFWRIFMIGLLSFVPLMAAGMLVRRLATALGGAPALASVIVSLADSIVTVATMAMFAVISSRLYQRLGGRLTRP